MSKILFQEKLSFKPQTHFVTLLVSIFWKFVKKWCGLKVNNYGISIISSDFIF